MDMQLYSRSPGRAKRLPSRGIGAGTLAEHLPVVVQFALSADDSRLNALIGDLVSQGHTGDAMVTNLIEPAARALGDAWLADDCSELELTIALGILQLAGHTIHSNIPPDRIRQSRYSILLATAPGEPHMLGPSLLGDMFNNAGWTVDIAFPDSDDALAQQLRLQQPDAVDIALSDALPRHHALALLRETIEKCRRVAPDEMMVISVGGRLFAEAAATARAVGADHARTTAAGTSVSLARLVEKKQRTP